MQADVGLIGLAVMGQNLVLNMESRGYHVAVYNRTVSRTEEFLNGPAKGKNIIGSNSLEQFIASMKRPRKVIIMVQAGAPVDAVIDQLIPLLSPGDLIMDGGNSYFDDTIKRENRLKEKDILFLGTGISGGEEGALHGPSMMPGGTEEAWGLMSDILTSIAAVVDGEPCCAYLGADGVGHFVKMVHNGIEYGDMQLICEAYFLMQRLMGLSAKQMSDVFAKWNEGDLQSYLIEITADILSKEDPLTGEALVDMILDEAQHKGTGMWTSNVALELGVPAPTITEAVYVRYISALKEERVDASRILSGPERGSLSSGGNGPVDETIPHDLIDDIGIALYAAKICSYAQGFALLSKGAAEYNWDLDLGVTASIWRGGCIIRAQFLDHIRAAYERDGELKNLLLDPYFTKIVTEAQKSWRRVAAVAALRGIPIPGLSSALNYYDLYRHERLPANLLQGQRDYFGAHTYKRIDREGSFHTEWTSDAT